MGDYGVTRWAAITKEHAKAQGEHLHDSQGPDGGGIIDSDWPGIWAYVKGVGSATAVGTARTVEVLPRPRASADLHGLQHEHGNASCSDDTCAQRGDASHRNANHASPDDRQFHGSAPDSSYACTTAEHDGRTVNGISTSNKEHRRTTTLKRWTGPEPVHRSFFAVR